MRQLRRDGKERNWNWKKKLKNWIGSGLSSSSLRRPSYSLLELIELISKIWRNCWELSWDSCSSRVKREGRDGGGKRRSSSKSNLNQVSQAAPTLSMCIEFHTLKLQKMTMNLDLETKKMRILSRERARGCSSVRICCYTPSCSSTNPSISNQPNKLAAISIKSNQKAASNQTNQPTNNNNHIKPTKYVEVRPQSINQSINPLFARSLHLASNLLLYYPSLWLHPTTPNIDSESIEFNPINNANQLFLLQSDCKPVTINLNFQSHYQVPLASRSIQRLLRIESVSLLLFLKSKSSSGSVLLLSSSQL